MTNAIVSEIIDLSKIIPDENQPRRLFEVDALKNLKDSVSKYGIMRPLTVEKIGDKYLIVDGERRYRVAKELSMKDVPAVVISPQTAVDRLVQQFHLQEQHADWTPTEKAVTIFRLSRELGVSVPQICVLLAIPDRTARRYLAFADIVDKKVFEKQEINLEWASSIRVIRNYAKNLYMNKIGEDFTRSMEKDLEGAIIRRIKNGEIKKVTDLTKVRDSFTKDPSYIMKFIETDITANSMFLKSKAHGAFYLRNIMSNGQYLENNLNRFMESMDIKLTEDNIVTLKRITKKIQELIDKVE